MELPHTPQKTQPCTLYTLGIPLAEFSTCHLICRYDSIQPQSFPLVYSIFCRWEYSCNTWHNILLVVCINECG